MAITASLYNHTAALFASGQINEADDFRLILCTAATFDATDALLTDVVYTQVANGNGYTTGGQLLSNVTVSTVNTDDAKFDADNVTWTASGGDIVASYALLYADTLAGDEPLLFIDFGGAQTAIDGANFLITWDAAGIFTLATA